MPSQSTRLRVPNRSLFIVSNGNIFFRCLFCRSAWWSLVFFLFGGYGPSFLKGRIRI